MDKAKYRPRLIDGQIRKHLSAFGAVCIEGPKWCGITWTSSFYSKSEVFIGDPAGNFQNRRLAELNPSMILDGQPPRLIDEWQEVPAIWDAVRYRVDQNPQKGQFLLTGSATPNHKGILHSGAGRIAKLRMRPMSLFESGDSSGKISLTSLCQGTIEPVMTGEVDLKKIIAYIVRGGWPASLGLPVDAAALLPTQYLEAVVQDDAFRVDGVKRDVQKMYRLLRSLARNESTTVTNATLRKDMRARDEEEIDSATISSYLDLFARLFLTDNQPPFSSRIRSSIRVKQAEKRHFADPSLACALLNATPEKLLSDLETLGFLFEALCERDLKIYAESFGANLYHYQDYRNREIDAVIELSDGKWGAFEIKLGANQIDAAAAGLLRIKREIEEEPGGNPPSILCVICGLSSAAYRREDGVFVVPITALRD